MVDLIAQEKFKREPGWTKGLAAGIVGFKEIARSFACRVVGKPEHIHVVW
jgi:hypothetical protein